MALSVVGRTTLDSLGIGTLYSIAQDPENLDSIYAVVYDGLSLNLYKFTWPDQVEFIVDTGVAWPTSWTLYGKGVIAQDIQYGLGIVDETLHYGFYIAGGNTSPYPNGVIVCDVNLSTLEVTTYQDLTVPNNSFAYAPLIDVFDAIGTYLVAAGGGKVVKKRLGQNSGTTYTVADALKPWLMIDDQSFVTLKSGSPNKWNRVYCQGSPALALLSTGGTYLPEPTTIDPTGTEGWFGPGRTTPGYALMWDDEWRYMLWRLTVSGGVRLVAVRKHMGSGAYSYAVIDPNHGGEEGGTHGAFDIWQTGETGAAGTVRKVFFTAGGQRNKVFSSPAWPMSMDNSLVLDTGTSSQMVVPAIWTNEEYAYVFHYGGTTYGSCITKVKDTDLIAEPDASPSISATGAKIVWKDKRVFFIKVPGYGRHLWWGAPFEPQSLDPSWDGYNTPVFENEDNTALQVYGDMVYVGSRAGWKRLRGKTPDYWVLDDIDGVEGPTTDKTVAVTVFGAIYPREDGLYLFNGYSTRLFYPQAKPLLASVNWTSIEKAFSVWDGRYFRFFYPAGGATENDRELIVDLIGGLENARATESDRAASSGFYDPVTKILFLGDEDGNLLIQGSSGSRSLEVTSKEFPAQGLLQAGTFQKLHYDADTLGEEITVTAYYDGVAQIPKSFSTTTRKRGHITLPKGNAYRVGIKIEITTDKDVKLYEPWVLE